MNWVEHRTNDMTIDIQSNLDESLLISTFGQREHNISISLSELRQIHSGYT